MPELPADFDLKLMPDWLKEPASKNPYADYEVREEDRRGRGRGGEGWGGGGGGGRPGGGRPGGPSRGAGGGRNDRGGNRPDVRGKKPGAPGGKRPEGGPDRRSPGTDRRPDTRDPRERGPAAPVQQAANVTIEFFPDEHAAASIAREIKSTHRAYSLFDLARMFLAKPERHRLKISTKSVAEPLYQVGENGPITSDQAAAERSAFPAARAALYVEETVQREAPKGNFMNVARCRANGQLLGPTSYHGYQPALRKLYDERFSRRMSFAEFQREIEVVNDPALIEQWKLQASSSTVYRVKPPEAAPKPVEETPAPPAAEVPAVTEPISEPENATPAEEPAPIEAAAEPQPEEAVESAPPEPAAPAPGPTPEGPAFANLAEVEQHFREHYLPGLVRVASSFQISGEGSRAITDRGIATAVRQAWEQERGFPGQVMHQLRQQFTRAGLHVFKHRKRMQFVSLIRPSPMEGGSLSPSVAEILRNIQADSRCTRVTLATAILGSEESAVDPARKSTLASDLRWLIDTGRVIEFSDGHLDLPLAPAKNEPAAKPEPAPAAEAPAQVEAIPAAEPIVTEIPATEEPAPEPAPEP